ncbi:MAG: DUF1828 domain-containing protein [Oscillospiraceae bacterium]|nr:DUF1828 domain-containing protein [Oscillospiraceae bacterium]
MDCQKMIGEYTEWLKKEITTASFGEYVEFTTPFLDRFNDYMQIYVKQNVDGTFSLTDDGYIIGNLISSGMTFRKGTNRRSMLDRIASNFNVIIDGEDITTTASTYNFPQKKHMMVQAMLSIDDLYVASPDSVKSMFLEDIETYFNANEIFFSRDFSVLGKTETIYTYDFLLQRTKMKPERFCRGINRLTQDRRDIALFNWADTQEKRGNTGELIIIFNDENTVSNDVLRGFYNYGIKTVPFSQRQQQENLQLFVA